MYSEWKSSEQEQCLIKDLRYPNPKELTTSFQQSSFQKRPKNPQRQSICSSLYSLGATTRFPSVPTFPAGTKFGRFLLNTQINNPHASQKRTSYSAISPKERFYASWEQKSNTRNCIYLSLEVTMFSYQLIMTCPLGILTVLSSVQDFRHTIKSAVEPTCIQSKPTGYHSN